MNEIVKLEEAQHFLSLCEKESGKKEFQFYLSAFLSASRSVLQYAREEAKLKAQGLTWYNKWMQTDAFIFFKDKRDFNIHSAPVSSRATHHISAEISIKVSTAVKLEIRDKNNVLLGSHDSDEEDSGKSAEKQKPDSLANCWTMYKFDDWTGTEDVIGLCKKYSQNLQALISDGVAKGFISG